MTETYRGEMVLPSGQRLSLEDIRFVATSQEVERVYVAGPVPGQECWTCHRRVPMTSAQRSANWRERKRDA